MLKKTTALTAAALSALLLAGCSAPAESEPDTAPAAAPAVETPAPEPVGQEGKHYSSVEELKDDFVAAGGVCPDWDHNNVVGIAAESGHCNGGNTVLSTYISQETRDQIVSNVTTDNILPVSLLVGENWVINAEEAADVEEQLRGTLVSKPGQE